MSKTLAYLQLVRLPNVFTALADVAMGFAVTHDLAAELFSDGWIGLVLLCAVSASLYMAGMVLNDAFDVEVDRGERPERPIPSGRIRLSNARILGFGLLGAGVLAALALSLLASEIRPFAVSMALGAAVIAYDAVIKRTPAGPIGMGLCRFLNVLLGMSLWVGPWETWHWVIAAGIGIYIIGVTWFARTEAHTSNRLLLLSATVVGAAGVLLLVWFPSWIPQELLVAAVRLDRSRWHMLWALLGLLIGWRCVWAIVDPRPLLVQRAVRQCIFSLIMLDAVVTFAVAGFVPAVMIMLLLLPTMFLGQFIYST